MGASAGGCDAGGMEDCRDDCNGGEVTTTAAWGLGYGGGSLGGGSSILITFSIVSCSTTRTEDRSSAGEEGFENWDESVIIDFGATTVGNAETVDSDVTVDSCMTTGCGTTLGFGETVGGETVGGETALSTTTVLSICRKWSTVMSFYDNTVLIVYQRNIQNQNL